MAMASSLAAAADFAVAAVAAMDASQRTTALTEDATHEHMRSPQALSARAHHQRTTEHMRSQRALSARADKEKMTENMITTSHLC